ncbi:hypothetical protein SLH46_13530 [Draconibacterium sp. IB214405]|uniref:hypothetical protein n=1 Tax=Draconibacterium sp. IB214405 TaxID=3097352 RepID=UPI002A0AB7F8|nr:hypothetical protein [Draconibacterium sp. IB214405]MDX8340215.1 hypothetical protein [Draconibacterium sp. IB214405]
MPVEIPLPIQFNPYKHHFRFLLSELENWYPDKPEEWRPKIFLIGNNLFDFYLGLLSSEKIAVLCNEYFNNRNINNLQSFNTWMGQRDWKKIQLPDESEWLIKRGNLEERYIHIHPAKYSKHTIRVRAATLKTVLVLCIYKIPISNDAAENLQKVNRLRNSVLNLSPINSLDDPDSGILKLWQLFADAQSK